MADFFPELSENDSTSLVYRKNSENTKKGTKFQRISRVSQGKKGRRGVTRVIDAKDKLANAYVLKRFYAEAGTHDPEPTTLLCSCNGVLTDRFIFRLNFPRMRLPQGPDDQLQQIKLTS